MIEIGAIASENTNVTLGRSGNDVTGIDHSYRLSRGTNIAEDVATVEMDFDDVVDMLNPLQHIPVVSSLYRAIAGEDINPVSRIAGDTLYGGAMGIASAGLAALGAIGDELISAANEGQSSSEILVASLFGDDTETTPQETHVAQATQNSKVTEGRILAAQALTMPGSNALTSADMGIGSGAHMAKSQTPGMALAQSKMPFGGVLDSAMMENAKQNQALALAMAGQRNALKAQHNLRTNRFAVAQPSQTAPAKNAEAAVSVAAAPRVAVETATQDAMQNLLKELHEMKSIGAYESAAQNMVVLPERKIDLVN